MLSDDHIRRAILTTFQDRNGADWARFPHIVEDEIRALRRNVNILTAANLVVVERDALRRLALRRHERPGRFGTFVPNGGSCMLCKGLWDHGAPEAHADDCPAALLAAIQETKA